MTTFHMHSSLSRFTRHRSLFTFHFLPLTLKASRSWRFRHLPDLPILIGRDIKRSIGSYGHAAGPESSGTGSGGGEGRVFTHGLAVCEGHKHYSIAFLG